MNSGPIKDIPMPKSPEPVNATLFGGRILVDGINYGSCNEIILDYQGWALNPMVNILLRLKKTHKRGDVTMETGIGGMQP